MAGAEGRQFGFPTAAPVQPEHIQSFVGQTVMSARAVGRETGVIGI